MEQPLHSADSSISGSASWFRSLKDMRIGTRLSLGLGLILAFVVLLGALAWRQTELQFLQTKMIYDHPFTVNSALLQFEVDALKIHRGMKDLCLAESDHEFATNLQHIDKAKADAYQQLAVLQDRYLGPSGDITTLQDEFVKWNSIHDETIRLLRSGKKIEAIARTKAGGVGGAQAEVLMGRIGKVEQFARNKADQFQRGAKELHQALNRHLAGLMAIILLLSLVITYALRRGIQEPLRQLTAAAEHSGHGKMDARCPYVSANEFGALSASFNAMADRLQTLFWLKDGLASLNQALSGVLSGDQLTLQGLTFISRYVNACAGAFYNAAQPGGPLELKAPYALGQGTCFAPQFQAGEGTVGQVAAEKKPIFLDGLRREEAVAMGSAVSLLPRSLYAVPLLYEEQLAGVLEVASLTDLDADKREFLDAAAGIMAVSLVTAARRDHIQTLLKDAQEANEELAAMNEELQAQAEELQAQAGELERQRLRVEEADRLKSEFLSNMSHELRTPLNSVLALTQLMQSRGTGVNPAQEAEYLQVIERSGRHLLHLINDILDIARIESGRVQVTVTQIDPRDTCARALETVRPLAVERGLELKAVYGDRLRMDTDEDKLRQILINFLSNAVKFTDHGEIELAAAAVGDRLRFSVRDTGVGIAPAVLPYIFEKFRQADGSSTRRFEGTGLGLAICRSLAEILGGEITVESQVGQGSTFVLDLPKTCPGLRQAEDG